MKWMTIALLWTGSALMAQGPPMLTANDTDEKIRYDMRRNLVPAGTAYAQLLTDGPDAKQYEILGDLYFDEEKPHQSKFYYELALAQAPDSASAQAGLQRAVDRIAYLASRFQMYSDKANAGGDATNFGSMAAIKFHQGYQQQAFQIIKDAVSVYGRDSRVVPLAKTFQRDIEYRLTVLDELISRYRALDLASQGDQAVELLGQVAFVSFGNPDILPFFEELKKSRPELLDEESYLLLREFTNTYPNQQK